MATVLTPGAHSTDTVHEPHNTAPGRAAKGSPAMTAAIYIRMPTSMLEGLQARAAARRQAPAHWVRACIARALRHPLPKPRERRLLDPDRYLKSLVGLQVAVADLGLLVQAMPAAISTSASLEVPDAKVIVSELRRISLGLVALIDEVRR